jgi:SAM-dependent methyltransferase
VAPVSGSDCAGSRFDRRASSYEDSPLQQFLFVPVQQTTLRLAWQLRPQARRVLDVGCGTGHLLRHTRPCYPAAELVGVDVAGRMVATASAITPTKLAVRYVHSRAEGLPFADEVFDLVFTTLSLRHWTDLSAGIAEIGRVLTPGGLLVLADVFPSCRNRGPVLPMLRRRRAAVPAELGAVLATHRLAVIGSNHTRWFGLPDVQVIAARHPHQPSANLPPKGTRRPVAPARPAPPARPSSGRPAPLAQARRAEVAGDPVAPGQTAFTRP